MSEQSEIRQLRQRVIFARLNREEAILNLKRVEAKAVLLLVDNDQDGWKALGPNEEARKLTITNRQAEDTYCKIARIDLREAEQALAEAEADVEAWLLARRQERVAATEKLADALLAGGLVAEVVS